MIYTTLYGSSVFIYFVKFGEGGRGKVRYVLKNIQATNFFYEKKDD